ncbi:ubiquitin family protein [Histoplasma capsulatum var. duboisii H88]|uniref:Ubiquitin family protein n=1 Tax=Ajellomyces capsulatus (strain H88) TaxID=544711 RepID=A0A8A1LM87_AJEC8|nr:ubiquitin family protein [Histoplasma capsulatum var. duboisii H88]
MSIRLYTAPDSGCRRRTYKAREWARRPVPCRTNRHPHGPQCPRTPHLAFLPFSTQQPFLPPVVPRGSGRVEPVWEVQTKIDNEQSQPS